MVFPGAGVTKRSWPVERFIDVCKQIITETSFSIMLAGAKSEIAFAEAFYKELPKNRIINKIGATTLTQVVELVAEARYVICNESSALHIAMACEVPTFCLLGGGHFNRFAPYPSYFYSKVIFQYEKMACFNCNWVCIFKTEENEPYPCISINKVEDASRALRSLMNN
jgi:ADP-heptose:LPS heptosyltransferase